MVVASKLKERLRMHHFTRKAIVVALCLFTVSLAAATASANTIRVRIDNRHTDNWENAKSTNPITVSIRFCSGCSWTSQTRTLNTISNSHDFLFDGDDLDAYDVYDVRVEIAGGGQNLFVMDQILLYDQPGNLVDWDGGDNTLGWCFSYQSSDYNNSHCYQSTGYWGKNFL